MARVSLGYIKGEKGDSGTTDFNDLTNVPDLQLQIDYSLNTTSKNIVGAINELNNTKLGKGDKAEEAKSADTATKLTNPRRINGVDFDGTTDITIDTTDNTKLPLTGGTLTGNLTVTGDILANGNVTGYSDVRFKEDIKLIDDALSKVISVSGYTFNMFGSRQAGVIAQEIREVLPEVVKEDENGYLSVAYGNIVALLIEAIKGLYREIEELKGGR